MEAMVLKSGTVRYYLMFDKNNHSILDRIFTRDRPRLGSVDRNNMMANLKL